MPKFISKDGKHTVETSVPREAAELRRDGFVEQKAPASKPKPATPSTTK